MKKLAFLLIAFCPPLFSVSPAGVYNNIVIGTNGRPVPGATITVCSYVASPTNPPAACSPSVSIFRDSALAVPKTNSFTGDNKGNFEFWAAPGKYTVQISGTGVTIYDLTAQVNCDPSNCGTGGGGGGGSPGGSLT